MHTDLIHVDAISTLNSSIKIGTPKCPFQAACITSNIPARWSEDAYLVKDEPSHERYFNEAYLPWANYPRILKPQSIVPTFMHSYARAHTYPEVILN
eukprot:4349460-Karenia_brevis.AAC.1